MLPGFTERQAQEQKAFIECVQACESRFPGRVRLRSEQVPEDALKLASKYIGKEFGCLSLTLEMPFKDNANLPDERVGWNGERSASLGPRCCRRSCGTWRRLLRAGAGTGRLLERWRRV
jgi:hypothetical protein